VTNVAELIHCAHALVGGRERRDYAFAVRDATIADAGDFAVVRARYNDVPVRAFPEDRLIIPGFINGHSHAYQILLRGWADDRSFERWRDNALYRVIPRLTADDVYWVFVVAFSEMLAAGITSVVEFFYLNGSGNAHAEAAIRASEDTGIRLVLARACMDAPTAPEAFRETASDAAEHTRELRLRHPNVQICIAPHSLHGASEAMLRTAAAFVEEEECDLHIHVAEAPYEAALSNERFGVSPVLALERFGVLSERAVAIHAIHLSEAEKDVLARRRVRVVTNPATNLYLGDGVTDVVGMRERGIAVGLGTDADLKPSILDEMRTAAYLQKLRNSNGAALDAGTAFLMGTKEGAAVAGVPAGDLATGMAADFIILDRREIDPWSPSINAVVYRAERSWVREAFVGGRKVYDGASSALEIEARKQAAIIAARLNF
jgi:5-methylthioadenosine/S-adenosylhomocysteine deaminase